MRQAWRWFGPEAGVPLDAVRQAGATDIVSALHEVPIGQEWTSAQIVERKNLIESTPTGRHPSHGPWSRAFLFPTTSSGAVKPPDMILVPG